MKEVTTLREILTGKHDKLKEIVTRIKVEGTEKKLQKVCGDTRESAGVRLTGPHRSAGSSLEGLMTFSTEPPTEISLSSSNCRTKP
jgi:hypothetical protein